MDWHMQPVMAVALPDLPELAPAALPVDAASPAADAFATLLEKGVSEVERSLRAAEGAVHDVAMGRPVELHDVMITLEKAALSVQTFVQVRNKLVESYQDLMRMQM